MATIDWTAVEAAEQTDTEEGRKLALLEADKLLRARLREEKVPGQTAGQQLAAAELALTRPKDVKAATQFVHQLREGDTPSLESDRARQYLQTYRQAVADITEYGQSRSELRTRLKLAVGLIKGRQRLALRIVGAIGAFCLAIVILADTGVGQGMTTGVVDLVHGIIKIVLLMLAVLIVVAGSVIVSAVILGRGPKGRIVEEEEEHGHGH